MRRALVVHRLVLTTCHQSIRAPIIDQCVGKTQEGQRWSGYAIHLTPWRKNRFGERRSGTALCVGVLRKQARG